MIRVYNRDGLQIGTVETEAQFYGAYDFLIDEQGLAMDEDDLARARQRARRVAIRAERERRQMALLEASTMSPVDGPEHLNEIIRTATTRSSALQDKRLRGETLTEAEQTYEALIRNMFAVFDLLVDDSNRLEQNPQIEDITADIHWSSFT